MKNLKPVTLDRPKCRDAYASLCKVIPGGVNSPVRAFKDTSLEPLVIERGSQDMIYDVDGNGYIDYCGSWGPLIHGHAHPQVLEAVINRMSLGLTFGITTEIEGALAKTIIDHMPSIEKIRFVSSGTEATMSATRLARGFTKRNLIVKFAGNYHGHADFFLVQAGSGLFGINATSSSAGIPEEIISQTICLPYNDIQASLNCLLHEDYRDRIAAVIIEPIAGNMGCIPATKEFLEYLRSATQEIGALLIFDEVINGFRVGLGGAQGLYDIKPDLTCLGKIIGGGFPAAAFGGRAEIMNYLSPLGPVYQAGTLSGNPVAMQAGFTSLQMLQVDGFYEELERKTNIITEPLKRLIKTKNLNMCVQQVGSMFTIFFGTRLVQNMEDAAKADKEAFNDFFHYLFNHGVYISPSQFETSFVSMAHQEIHLTKTRDLILDYLHRS